tara:strand:+ start:1936 stop:2055 length:120 start_codon:yes stop_codon:yes gene_type:complete
MSSEETKSNEGILSPEFFILFYDSLNKKQTTEVALIFDF